MAKKKNNNNYIKIIIPLVVALLVFTVVLAVVISDKGEKKERYETNYISLGIFNEDLRVDNNVLTSYEAYKNVFKDLNNEITEEIFYNNNYAVVEILYDECSEKNVRLKSYDLNNDELEVIVTYDSTCGVCAPQYIYYLVPLDKSVTSVTVNVKSVVTSRETCDPNVAYKPIIYLYPESTTSVEVKLGNSSYLTTTYPKYNNGWKVTASPNGDLVANNRYYYGLYWEGINHKAEVKEDGFIVEGSKAEEFLEEKLALLGLNEREADEFIIYWLPKLEVNKYNYIRFETKEEIDKYMPLEINPNPDTVIRVLMDYKALDEPIEVVEQKLTTPERVGFTVVEWGGSIIE